MNAFVLMVSHMMMVLAAEISMSVLKLIIVVFMVVQISLVVTFVNAQSIHYGTLSG